MRNVELKAELRDPTLAAAVCRKLGAIHIGNVTHTDTYYRVPDGKLLKRDSSSEPTEWIFVHRDDAPGLKTCVFTIYSERQARERFGEIPLPKWITVRKTRHLWIRDNVRIHIDDVEGIGRFIEIEALVTPCRNVEQCEIDVLRMRRVFGPILGESIGPGYSDMAAIDAA